MRDQEGGGVFCCSPVVVLDVGFLVADCVGLMSCLWWIVCGDHVVVGGGA